MKLQMVYTWDMKGLEQVENMVEGECTLHCWTRSSESCVCSRPF